MVTAQGFDEERRWGGFGNVLNFDWKTKKPIWSSSWSHRIPRCVVEQRWFVRALSQNVLTSLSYTMHPVNSIPVVITSANKSLSLLQQVYSTFLQQFPLSKISVVSQKRTPYLVWDTHALVVNMGATYTQRESRFQYAYSFQK